MDSLLKIALVRVLSDSMGFPGGSDGKASTCNAGDLGLIPGLGRSPGGGHGSPLQYFFLENLHGLGSLVSYDAWVRKELYTTERLSTAHFGPMQSYWPSRLSKFCIIAKVVHVRASIIRCSSLRIIASEF